jgi:hypothetical protein
MPRTKAKPQQHNEIVHSGGDNTNRILEQVSARKYVNKEWSPVTVKFLQSIVDLMEKKKVPVTATRLKDMAITYGVADYGIDAYVEVIHNEVGTLDEFSYFLSTVGCPQE